MNSKYTTPQNTPVLNIARGVYFASVIMDTQHPDWFEIAIMKNGKIVNIIKRYDIDSAKAQIRKWANRYPNFMVRIHRGAETVW